MQLCSSSPSELALLPDMTAQFFQGLFEGLLMQSVPESSDIKYNGWGGAGRVTGPGWIVSPLSWFHLPSTYFPSASCWPESCAPKGVRRACAALTSWAPAKHMFCSAGSPPDPHPPPLSLIRVDANTADCWQPDGTGTWQAGTIHDRPAGPQICRKAGKKLGNQLGGLYHQQ